MILPMAKNIYSYVLHIVSNSSDAADLTQDIMVKLWDTRSDWQKIQNPKAWVFKVARNLCFDWLKKQKPTYCDSPINGSEGYTQDLQQEIENRDTVALIQKILHTLPDPQREVIILRDVEELEFDEIEQITGLTPNYIRVLLSRGRSKVKEMVEKLGVREVKQR